MNSLDLMLRSEKVDHCKLHLHLAISSAALNKVPISQSHQLYSLRSICKIQWRLCWLTFGCDICLFTQHIGFVRLGLVEISVWPLGASPSLCAKKRGEGKVTFVRPPSTTKSVPLTKLLSSLARKTTAWACSMASPKRPVGKWTSRRWRLAASSPSQS